MPVKVVLGLPYLSKGPLLAKASELKAPVLVSANSFSRWVDEGPAPASHEFSWQQSTDHARRGSAEPIIGRKQRMRRWSGWNLGSLKNAHVLEEVWLDSAGFTMQFLENGYPWTPEDYILNLCTAYPWTRFASLDLCVEQEICGDRIEVRERISKTVSLNYRCQTLANDVGLGDKLMPVIQGSTPDDYLRCFDAMEGMIGDNRLIGVGSMCRRHTAGPDGIVAIVDALDRRLPSGVQLHLFGLKGQGAAAIADLDERVYSIDSQAYGVRARRIANDRRLEDPTFSKSNAFVAEVMETWYNNQCQLMAAPNVRPIQNSLILDFPSGERPSLMDRLIERAHAEINDLIEQGEIDAAQPITHHMIQQWIFENADDPDSYDLINLPMAA